MSGRATQAASPRPHPVPVSPRHHAMIQRVPRSHEPAEHTAPPPRVVIEEVTPEVDGGRFPAKREVGDRVRVQAAVFAEGHDRLAGVLRFRPPGADAFRETALCALPNDYWEAFFDVDALGRWAFTLEAWLDPFASWLDGLRKKVDAAQDVSLELREGAALVDAAAGRAADAGALEDAQWLDACATALAGGGEAGRAAGLDAELAGRMARHPDRGDAVRLPRVLEIEVERERARRGAWYEMFPRSCAPEPGRHGTLRDCEARLDYVAAMGFDVVYLPPVHPVGFAYRKGPDNTPEAGPDDPGSPWAIGSADGGHKAVHPALGTLADFDRLVARARELGLEIALDIAFQCSPDHPYVAKHPEWFRKRPDGSIAYAENPPKKYQDIYPLHFEQPAWRALWEELRSVFLFWVDHGVTIFRVDNPHTKPFAFWEWVIAEVKARHPEAIFLSEAFTRPHILHWLAKAGFSQSYTYFTWRNEKWELMDYTRELWSPPGREYLRPNFFTNTPDILHAYLQEGGRPAHRVRYLLAATLVDSFGIYGPPFELCEAEPLKPGSEEYRHSEKYEVRHWDLDRPGHIRDWITRINAVRRGHPALRRGDAPAFHDIDDDRMLAWSRATPDRGAAVLAVANLDPHHTRSAWMRLRCDVLGLPWDQPVRLRDLLGGGEETWDPRGHHVTLDPGAQPARLLTVVREDGP